MSGLRASLRDGGAVTNIKPDLTITDLPDASPSDPLEALSWLGETVEEVAEGLRARGIKGKPREAKFCVLAMYLRVWWPGECTLVACGTSWVGEDRHPKKYINPDHVRSFEMDFDHGRFPDLIAYNG